MFLPPLSQPVPFILDVVLFDRYIKRGRLKKSAKSSLDPSSTGVFQKQGRVNQCGLGNKGCRFPQYPSSGASEKMSRRSWIWGMRTCPTATGRYPRSSAARPSAASKRSSHHAGVDTVGGSSLRMRPYRHRVAASDIRAGRCPRRGDMGRRLVAALRRCLRCSGSLAPFRQWPTSWGVVRASDRHPLPWLVATLIGCAAHEDLKRVASRCAHGGSLLGAWCRW